MLIAAAHTAGSRAAAASCAGISKQQQLKWPPRSKDDWLQISQGGSLLEFLNWQLPQATLGNDGYEYSYWQSFWTAEYHTPSEVLQQGDASHKAGNKYFDDHQRESKLATYRMKLSSRARMRDSSGCTEG